MLSLDGSDTLECIREIFIEADKDHSTTLDIQGERANSELGRH